MMFTVLFWKAAFERAISTFAQVAVLLIGADMANWLTLNWLEVGQLALIGGGLSILKGIAAGAVSHNNSPSIGNVEKLPVE